MAVRVLRPLLPCACALPSFHVRAFRAHGRASEYEHRPGGKSGSQHRARFFSRARLFLQSACKTLVTETDSVFKSYPYNVYSPAACFWRAACSSKYAHLRSFGTLVMNRRRRPDRPAARCPAKRLPMLLNIIGGCQRKQWLCLRAVALAAKGGCTGTRRLRKKLPENLGDAEFSTG